VKQNKLKMGMVGGGAGAFIGNVHRLAARLDGEIDLVCGAFSRDAENCRVTGEALGVAPSRSYTDFKDMMQAEAALPPDERMDFVAIVTPNHVHFPVAKAALEAGFSVLSDKPATLDLKEAVELREIVTSSKGLAYGLTHTYLGYPLLEEARAIIDGGGIGNVRKVFVEYIQGWLATEVDNKQADWRTDPARSGGSGCMGDIGTHAHNLAEFGVGAENALSIRVYGETGGLEWRQEEPNTLMRSYADRPTELIRSAQGYLSAGVQDRFRTPPGHPEGYIEAFANCYRDFGSALRDGGGVNTGIDAAVRGMAFIEALLESSDNNSVWTEIKQ